MRNHRPALILSFLLLAGALGNAPETNASGPYDEDNPSPLYRSPRPSGRDYEPPPPRVQSWMDNKGDITYLFNYGRTTMPVPLDQLTHPNQGPTFDPFGVIGQGYKDDGWLTMPKRRTK